MSHELISKLLKFAVVAAVFTIYFYRDSGITNPFIFFIGYLIIYTTTLFVYALAWAFWDGLGLAEIVYSKSGIKRVIFFLLALVVILSLSYFVITTEHL